MELAQTLEMASKNAQMKATEHAPSGSSTMHKVASPSKRAACYWCGLSNHKANECHFKEATSQLHNLKRKHYRSSMD